MLKLAIYGKGGIGKSTVAANCAAALAARGLRVLQIGCDPKADSTAALRGGKTLTPVLELLRRSPVGDFPLEAMVLTGPDGVFCVEAGGPVPGVGCAGRGIIAALGKLEEKGAYEILRPDVVLYDVLGDVVCGGFTMPMRQGYADFVCIVTSGEPMAVYAAANIALAVRNFQGRGYAKLGGFILNRSGVPDEDDRVRTLVRDFGSRILGTLDRSADIPRAEAKKETVVRAFPDSPAAAQFRTLADALLELRENSSC